MGKSKSKMEKKKKKSQDCSEAPCCCPPVPPVPVAVRPGVGRVLAPLPAAPGALDSGMPPASLRDRGQRHGGR